MYVPCYLVVGASGYANIHLLALSSHLFLQPFTFVSKVKAINLTPYMFFHNCNLGIRKGVKGQLLTTPSLKGVS